jgi:hypothetical protein
MNASNKWQLQELFNSDKITSYAVVASDGQHLATIEGRPALTSVAGGGDYKTSMRYSLLWSRSAALYRGELRSFSVDLLAAAIAEWELAALRGPAAELVADRDKAAERLHHATEEAATTQRRLREAVLERMPFDALRRAGIVVAEVRETTSEMEKRA